MTLNEGLRAWQAKRRETRREGEALHAEAEAAWRAAAPVRRRVAIRAQSAKRRAVELQRTPAWADVREIAKVYAEAARLTAETGIEHHVDHELPLQGRLVSGLHVHQNLRVLPAADNIRKSNHFEVEP